MAVAWQIIARRGMDGVTLRSVAAEAGFTNGALKPYFPSKDDLMLATFEFVCARVAERVEATTAALRGFDAVRAFSREILPINQNLVDEARVIIGFWALAAHDDGMRRVNDAAMGVWRYWLSTWVGQQREDSGFREGITVDILVDGLMTFLLGAQVSVTVDRVAVSRDKMSAHLDTLLNAYLPDDVWWEPGRAAVIEAAELRSVEPSSSGEPARGTAPKNGSESSSAAPGLRSAPH